MAAFILGSSDFKSAKIRPCQILGTPKKSRSHFLSLHVPVAKYNPEIRHFHANLLYTK